MMQVCAENNKHRGGSEAASSSSTAASSGAEGAADAEKDKDKDSTATPAGGAALLSIAAIAFSDDLSREMCMRMVEHILQYGNLQLRRTVPLAIGLLFVSNAKQAAIDLLSTEYSTFLFVALALATGKTTINE